MAVRKEEVIARIQELGCIHLIRLAQEEPETSADTGVAVVTRRALKYLRARPVQRRQVQREQFDRAQVAAEAIDIQRRERELTDEQHALLTSFPPWETVLGNSTLCVSIVIPTAYSQMWREEVSDTPNMYARTLSGVYTSMLSPSVDPP